MKAVFHSSFITLADLNDVVSTTQVQFGEDASPTKLFQGGWEQRKWVAIFDIL